MATQIIITANVLGAPIEGVYEDKKITTESVEVGDDSISCDVIESKIHVYGTPKGEPQPKKITELISEIGTLLTVGLIKKETIENALPEALKDKLDNITFLLKQVYFAKLNYELKADNSADQNKLEIDSARTTNTLSDKYKNISESSKTALAQYEDQAEYAFWIQLDIDKSLMAGFPIVISEISIKLWDTENEKILEEMGINAAEDLTKSSIAS